MTYQCQEYTTSFEDVTKTFNLCVWSVTGMWNVEGYGQFFSSLSDAKLWCDRSIGKPDPVLFLWWLAIGAIVIVGLIIVWR